MRRDSLNQEPAAFLDGSHEKLIVYVDDKLGTYQLGFIRMLTSMLLCIKLNIAKLL